MVISTITIRVNGFYPNIFLTFAIWTMRPRMFGPLLWWIGARCVQGTASNAYLWTFKDSIIEESLLNTFSLPFALYFAIAHQFVTGDSCAGNTHYERFWLSFYIIIAAGIISALLLLLMVLHYSVGCLKRSRPEAVQAAYEIVPGASSVRKAQQGGLGRFWKWTLTIGGLNMLLAFAGQWLLWGSESRHQPLSDIALTYR